MRLINVHTRKLESFYDELPMYAILSHTWGEDEVIFADMQNPSSLQTTSKAGFNKVARACEQALRDSYDYVWIDTCCMFSMLITDVSFADLSVRRHR